MLIKAAVQGSCSNVPQESGYGGLLGSAFESEQEEKLACGGWLGNSVAGRHWTALGD